MKDHVHLVVTVPPKVSISELMGFLKGKKVDVYFASMWGCDTILIG